MKNILIVYNKMNTGGIETLILRLAKHINKQGGQLKVLLTFGGGDILEELSKIANVKSLEIQVSLKSAIFRKIEILNDPFYENIEEIFSMYGGGNWIGLQLSLILGIPFKVGIYHPRDYEKYVTKSEANLFNYIPDKCKLFMNSDCLKSHENIYVRKIKANIWPLPVINENEHPLHKSPHKNILISVGRLVKFKTYNISMLYVIKQLLDEGFNIKYYIYGEGELKDKMSKIIIKNKLEKNIFLMGHLDYSLFNKVVSAAYLFVGTGTAVIETSFLGVPSIIATVYSETGEANGFFSEIDGYNVGEPSPDIATKPLIDLIRTVLLLSDSEYSMLSRDHRDTAKEKYGINHVMSIFDSFPKINIEPCLKLKILLLKCYFSFKIYIWKSILAREFNLFRKRLFRKKRTKL